MKLWKLWKTYIDIDDGFLGEEAVDYLPLQALEVVVGALSPILTYYTVNVGHRNCQEVLLRGAVNHMGRLDFTCSDKPY